MGVRKQEAAQRTPRRIVTVGLVPQAQEHLLHDVLRERLDCEQPACEAVDRAGVAPVGLGERFLAVARDPDRQRGVRELGDVLLHI